MGQPIDREAYLPMVQELLTLVDQKRGLANLEINDFLDVDEKVKSVVREILKKEKETFSSDKEGGKPIKPFLETLTHLSTELDQGRYVATFNSISNICHVFLLTKFSTAKKKPTVQENLDDVARAIIARDYNAFNNAMNSLKETYSGDLLNACSSEGRTLLDWMRYQALDTEFFLSFFRSLQVCKPSLLLTILKIKEFGKTEKLAIIECLAEKVDFSLDSEGVNREEVSSSLGNYLIELYSGIFGRQDVLGSILPLMFAKGFDANISIRDPSTEEVTPLFKGLGKSKLY